ncbi:MAG: hypothetical protein VW554_03440, partial [Alphaproteobacteria bacterium]
MTDLASKPLVELKRDELKRDGSEAALEASAEPAPLTDRVDLLGLDIDALTEAVKAEGLPAFRARQIWRWV